MGLFCLSHRVLGFGLALILMLFLNKIVKNKDIFKEPQGKKPPMWIRGILVLTCTSVSYAHGSNDGQKGVGLIMLILIAFASSFFALDRSQPAQRLFIKAKKIEWTLKKADTLSLNDKKKKEYKIIQSNLTYITANLRNVTSIDRLNKDVNFNIRKSIFLVSKNVDLILKELPKDARPFLKPAEITILKFNIRNIKSHTEYAPRWVIL